MTEKTLAGNLSADDAKRIGLETLPERANLRFGVLVRLVVFPLCNQGAFLLFRGR